MRPGNTRDHQGSDPVVGLRKVTADDAPLLYRWANDPQTRRNSLSSDPIEFDDHLEWLHSMMEDPLTPSFIAHTQWDDLGTVALDLRPSVQDDSHSPNRHLLRHGRVSITVAPIHRGCGYATPMLRAVCRKAKDLGVPTLEAVVKRHNEPSLCAFRSCGFWVSRQRGDIWTLDYRL